MRRAVLANADGVVRQNVEHRQLHQRRQADAVLHVVGEDQERAGVGLKSPVHLHAVDDAGHGLLADAEVQVAALGRLGGEVAAALDVGLVGGRKVGRAADEVGHARGELGKHLAAGVARCVLLVLELPVLLVVFQVRDLPGVPALHLGVELGIGGLVALEHLLPGRFGLGTLFRDLLRLLVDLGRNVEELLRVKAQLLLQRRDVLRAKRLAVGGVLAGLCRAVRADDGAHHDQRRPGVGLGAVDGIADGVDVLAVLHFLHVPAVGLVALHRVLAQGQLHIALDGDVVAVVKEDELI